MHLLSTIAQGMQLYCIRGCRFTVFVLEVAVLGWTLGALLEIPWEKRAGAVSLDRYKQDHAFIRHSQI